MRLADKVIIVTGSTTGIGEAIARRCAAQGARVMVHGRDEQRAQLVAREIGDPARYFIGDVADADFAGRIVQSTLDAFGRIDGVVNNAAWVVRSNLASTNAELFDRVMAVNVRGPLLLLQAAMPHLVESEGAVVNIGSVNAYTGEARQLDYSISKAALMCLSRNLANAYAPQHVRINHFNVGWVITPNEYRLKMKEGLPEGWHEQVNVADVPTGRMTQPTDIAAHAVFWLSDESRPVTGSVMELEQHPVIGRLPVKEGQSSFDQPLDAL